MLSAVRLHIRAPPTNTQVDPSSLCDSIRGIGAACVRQHRWRGTTRTRHPRSAGACFCVRKALWARVKKRAGRPDLIWWWMAAVVLTQKLTLTLRRGVPPGALSTHRVALCSARCVPSRSSCIRRILRVAYAIACPCVTARRAQTRREGEEKTHQDDVPGQRQPRPS